MAKPTTLIKMLSFKFVFISYYTVIILENCRQATHNTVLFTKFLYSPLPGIVVRVAGMYVSHL